MTDTALAVVANLLALAILPIALSGIVVRVKARWAGRRGPPIFQLAYDLRRLARKTPVYSAVTTPVFRVGPVVVLVTALASACLVPLVGARPLASFDFDFVWFAYVWGFGRVALVLGALDTGSSFEGMGAAREATFSVVLEPVLFLVLGALCVHGGARTLDAALAPRLDSGAAVTLWVAAIVALVIALQVESARMPVDDPTTHLELTMVHEVMILDHSGPELALLQWAGAIKLFLGASVIASLLDPWTTDGGPLLRGAVHVALCVGVATGLGLAESLVARVRLRAVPQYIVVALVAAVIALLSLLARTGAA